MSNCDWSGRGNPCNTCLSGTTISNNTSCFNGSCNSCTTRCTTACGPGGCGTSCATSCVQSCDYTSELNSQFHCMYLKESNPLLYCEVPCIEGQWTLLADQLTHSRFLQSTNNSNIRKADIYNPDLIKTDYIIRQFKTYVELFAQAKFVNGVEVDISNQLPWIGMLKANWITVPAEISSCAATKWVIRWTIQLINSDNQAVGQINFDQNICD